MNRLKFILQAKNQYGIHSPFLFKLYEEVVAPRLGVRKCRSCGISVWRSYDKLLYKIKDHYGAEPISTDSGFTGADAVLRLPDGTDVVLVKYPHRTKSIEEAWHSLTDDERVTLSVDLFHTGLAFTSPRLARQHILLRPF